MDGLYLGIDLGDRWCQAGWFDPKTKNTGSLELYDNNEKIETLLCKRIGEEYWCIGQEAWDYSRAGKGILVENLKITETNNLELTVDGEQYQASQLLEIFFERLIGLVLEKTGHQKVRQISITMRENNAVLADQLVTSCTRLGIERSKVHVLNYCEAFMYYVLSRRSDVRKSLCSLFEFSDQGLYYYEFRTIRGRKPVHVNAVCEKQGEFADFDQGFQEDPADGTDELLLASAQRLMEKKLITSVFLTGEAFDRGTDWAPGFLRYICHSRKVFSSPNLFAQGAAAAAWSGEFPSYFPYILLCEGRLDSTISMEVVRGDNQYQLILASIGTNWYEAKTTVEFILEEVNHIRLNVERFGDRLKRPLEIALEGFPERAERTTRVEMTLAFLADDYMMVRVRDLGFGDLFPSSGAEIRKYYHLTQIR